MAMKRRIAVMMSLDQPYKHHINTFSGICDYAKAHDHWELITNDWADQMLPTRAGEPSPYDGLIGRITSLGARRAKRLGVPVVNVHFNSPAKGLPGVFSDTAETGRLEAEHLLARGFRDLAFLDHALDRGTIEHGDAFDQAALDAGCNPSHRMTLSASKQGRMGIDDLSWSDHRQWNRVMKLIGRWMDQWRVPTGVCIYDLSIARLVIEKCGLRGWRIPEDIAIISGWNDEGVCLKPEPSITSIAFANEKIGYEAARMLDELIDEKENPTIKGKKKPRTIFLPPVGIVARQSTDFFAVDDLVVRKALGYMDQNLHRPIIIEDIAEYADVSRVTLTTRFREKLGRSVTAEMQRLRVERVKRELTGTGKPVYKIAQSVGYSDARSLKPVFRKWAGCTPAEFRKQAEVAKQ